MLQNRASVLTLLSETQAAFQMNLSNKQELDINSVIKGASDDVNVVTKALSKMLHPDPTKRVTMNDLSKDKEFMAILNSPDRMEGVQLNIAKVVL